MDEKPNIQDIIGKNLRKFRQQAKLSQNELAKQAGISASFLANIERGTKGMSINSLHQLCCSLGVSSDLLLFEPSQNKNINNIEMLLKDKPKHVIFAAEQLVRVLIEAVEHKENKDIDRC